MPKLEASAFRVEMTGSGRCTLSFQSAARREFHVTFGGQGLAQLLSMMTEAAKTRIPLSTRQATGYRRIAEMPEDAIVDVPQPDRPGTIYGAAVSTDLTMVIPYFNFPNDDAGGFKQVAITMLPADAQKLIADLQRAVSVVVRKPNENSAEH